jgi:putative molybdopterin biosynthesis protein
MTDRMMAYHRSPMTEAPGGTGARLRLARQARGFTQQQLASMAGVSRQAVSAVESGYSDPSLRVALGVAQALGLSVEELFGPGEPAAPVTATSIASVTGPGQRVSLASVGDRFVALPLRGDRGTSLGFLPAGGLAVSPGLAPRTAEDAAGTGLISVRPVGPPRPTLVVAGCDPALPLLATPLALLDPLVAFAWWPCGSREALRLASEGLVHAAGVHAKDGGGEDGLPVPEGADVVGFTAWREGIALRPQLTSVVTGLDTIARHGLRIVNREPGAEARRLLDAECCRLGLEAADLPGYDTQAAGHLQVASAISAGLAAAGLASEPAARAYGLAFVPLADEHFTLVIPAKHAASREVQALLKVLSSPWLLAQLASLPGYDAASCGERLALGIVSVTVMAGDGFADAPGRRRVPGQQRDGLRPRSWLSRNRHAREPAVAPLRPGQRPFRACTQLMPYVLGVRRCGGLSRRPFPNDLLPRWSVR